MRSRGYPHASPAGQGPILGRSVKRLFILALWMAPSIPAEETSPPPQPQTVREGRNEDRPKDYSGVWITRGENGQKSFEWEYKDGHPEGWLIWYYPSGKLEGKSFAKN